MENDSPLIHWANECLAVNGFNIVHSQQFVVKTPWSTVMRFSTGNGDVYLKQTPPSLFLEPTITQLLANQFHASVPTIIGINHELHCFMMKDAGPTLRAYLNDKIQPDLLRRGIEQFTTMQRSVENHIELFIALGVPDWRLKNLPSLFNQLLNEVAFLKADGITDMELKKLYNLIPNISKQCEQLSQYQIPETIVQPDFNSNNILIDPNTLTMTFIDLGEIAITHPFFSLNNFLYKTYDHYGIREVDPTYIQLKNACINSWSDIITPDQFTDAFMLAKSLWPIYSVLAMYRLLIGIDLKAFQTYYAKNPHRLAECFREYIALNS